LTLQVTVVRRMSLDPLLLGFYAWSLTVAVPAFSPGAPLTSAIASGAAFIILLTAWLLAPYRPIAADVIVAVGYLGLCFVAWLALGHLRLTSSQAELRTVLGAVAWSLFGVSWVRSRYLSGVRDFHESKTDASSVLVPNRKSGGWVLHLAFSVLLVLAVFLKLGMPKGDGRGVLITAVALAWSLWFIATSGVLAEHKERRGEGLGLRLLGEPWIILAVFLSVAGVVLSSLLKV
jgi:hypothetical protein